MSPCIPQIVLRLGDAYKALPLILRRHVSSKTSMAGMVGRTVTSPALDPWNLGSSAAGISLVISPSRRVVENYMHSNRDRSTTCLQQCSSIRAEKGEDIQRRSSARS